MAACTACNKTHESSKYKKATEKIGVQSRLNNTNQKNYNETNARCQQTKHKIYRMAANWL